MALPSLIDVGKIMVKPKKVIKASEADEKVKKMTEKESPKNRSAKEIRGKLYGSKE